MPKKSATNPSGYARPGKVTGVRESNRVKAEKWDAFARVVQDARAHPPYSNPEYEEARAFLADQLGEFFDEFDRAHPDAGPGSSTVALDVWKRMSGWRSEVEVCKTRKN